VQDPAAGRPRGHQEVQRRPDRRTTAISTRFTTGDTRGVSENVEVRRVHADQSLAETQLFGITPRVATDVGDRPGVFEIAGRGHMPKGKDVTLTGR
jgi:hypothetical protein